MNLAAELEKRLNAPPPAEDDCPCGVRPIAEGNDPSTLCARRLGLCYKCWRTPKVREARKKELGIPGRKPKKRWRR